MEEFARNRHFQFLAISTIAFTSRRQPLRPNAHPNPIYGATYFLVAHLGLVVTNFGVRVYHVSQIVHDEPKNECLKISRAANYIRRFRLSMPLSFEG